MNIAYVISAYKLPDQLVRLVERLDAPGASFTIHVDARAPQRVFRRMADGLRARPNVEFVERHASYWGGFGHVRATLKGVERLIRDGIAFGYLVLLTGQDYPLCPPNAISRTLAESDGRSFMSHWPLPHAPWAGRGGLDRIERYHLIRGPRLHVALPARRRRLPDGLRPFGGGPYWCLARAAVDYVHSFVATNPRYARFFEHVFVPDEIFFQTLLLNSPLAPTVIDDSLRYVDWNTMPAPAILRVADLEQLLASPKLFARKFDTTVDAVILDRLDDHIDRAALGT